jgi:hypothetical protein
MGEELIVGGERYSGLPQMIHHDSSPPDRVARLAIVMIEKWGITAAKPDGEDSSGRAKLAMLPVDEMVARAFETAELVYKVAAERGHLLQGPTWAEAQIIFDEQRKRN